MRISDAKTADARPIAALMFETVARPVRLRTNPRPPRRFTGNSTPESSRESSPLADPTSSTSSGDLPAASSACDRQRRNRVTRGSTPSDEGESPACHERSLGGSTRLRERRSCDAMFTRMPAAQSVITRDDPPKEMNGRGIPVTGSTSITAPMFMTAWLTIQHVMPIATSIAKRSGALRAALSPSQPRPRNRPRTKSAPTSPVSSPITEKMKSVCGLGRRPHFSRLAPNPRPYRRPDPIPTRDWTT